MQRIVTNKFDMSKGQCLMCEITVILFVEKSFVVKILPKFAASTSIDMFLQKSKTAAMVQM